MYAIIEVGRIGFVWEVFLAVRLKWHTLIGIIFLWSMNLMTMKSMSGELQLRQRTIKTTTSLGEHGWCRFTYFERLWMNRRSFYFFTFIRLFVPIFHLSAKHIVVFYHTPSGSFTVFLFNNCTAPGFLFYRLLLRCRAWFGSDMVTNALFLLIFSQIDQMGQRGTESWDLRAKCATPSGVLVYL